MSVKTDLLWIAVRFVAKSVVIGLAVFALCQIFFPAKPEGVRIQVLPDPKHNIVCVVTNKGGIACLNVVLST